MEVKKYIFLCVNIDVQCSSVIRLAKLSVSNIHAFQVNYHGKFPGPNYVCSHELRGLFFHLCH